MIRACLRGFSTQPYATNDSRRPNVLGGVEQIAGIVLSLQRREPFVLGAVRRPHTALAFVRFLLHVVHIDALWGEWAQRLPDPKIGRASCRERVQSLKCDALRDYEAVKNGPRR